LLVEIEDLVDAEAVVKYIQERQNTDGGYTFCRGAESNAQDTYYAIEILRLLNVQPRNTDRTVNFLKSLQHSDGRFDSVKVAYFVIASLSHLGDSPVKPIDKYAESIRSLIEDPQIQDVYIEATSEIESIYFAVNLLKRHGSSLSTDQIQKRLLSMQNADGSFGSERFSRIASTYYALKTLKVIGYNIKRLPNVHHWIRQCEVPSGGFKANPKESSTYIVMEDIYYGVKTLEALNEKCRYPRETLKLIAKFQNPNGGFRRSIFLGISDFESTYQAVSSIRSLLIQQSK